MILDKKVIPHVADLLISRNPATEEWLRQANCSPNNLLLQAAEQARLSVRVVVPIPSLVLSTIVAIPMFELIGQVFQMAPNKRVGFGLSLWALLCTGVRYVSARICARTFTRRQAIALELARRGDIRAVGPLLDEWTPGVQGEESDEPTPATVEAVLARVLPVFVEQGSLPLDFHQMARVRNKLEELFAVSRLSRPAFAPSDFSDRCADILITLIQILARSPDAHNLALVARIAAHPGDLPNRILVRDAAHVCRDAADERARTTQKTAPFEEYLAINTPTISLQAIGARQGGQAP